MSCDVVRSLRSIGFGEVNSSSWDEILEGCGLVNSTSLPDQYDVSSGGEHDNIQYGGLFYACVTPLIICAGVLGNLISLRVFFSRRLRKLSASVYMAAISISDLMVLLIYVLLDWLRKGLPHFPRAHSLGWIINTPGICETFLYFSYLFRFVSVWLIVVFTIERYIAACRPLQRKLICTKTVGRRAIMGVTVVGSLISLFKPVISGIYGTSVPERLSTYRNDDEANDVMGYSRDVCRFRPGYERVNFMMEVTYGISITAVPFVVIALFNALILRALMQRHANMKRFKVCLKDNRIRLEFTVTLLVVSTSFVCLNLPYFVYWCQRNILATSHTTADGIKNVNTRDQFYVTLTIYYMNYCINFFLYCLTGTYYRKALKVIFCCQNEARGYRERESVASLSCPTAMTSLKDATRS